MSGERTSTTKAPKVFLVGAGPGDPGLLTVNACNLLKRADVVVYDRLVSKEILDIIPVGAARINVGKQPNCHPVPQHEINELLVSLARDGRCVVRLKGGDPYMFGRASEEAMHLLSDGIDFEVIPGVTAATGCSAAAGVPLTHRGMATSVRYITGHCRDDVELDLDWKGLTDPDTTLAIYMGVANMAKISVKLISNGMPSTHPAMAISQGTTKHQRQLVSTVGEIADQVADANLPGPIIFIVGRVVELADVLAKDAAHEVIPFGIATANEG